VNKLKLSKAQEKAVEVLKNHDEFNGSYHLQLNMNTLDSLVRKGMVERKHGIGSAFCPHTNIKYR